MIIDGRNEDGSPKGFRLFYENQEITNIAFWCEASDKPNVVTEGIVKVYLHNKEKIGDKIEAYTVYSIEEGTPELIEVELKGLVFWCSDEYPDDGTRQDQYVEMWGETLLV